MKLTIHQEGASPVQLKITGPEFTIGRHPDCDVVLTPSFVSGHHARVFAGVLVEDLGSRNGTFVDGCRIQAPTLLTDGRFRVGGEALTIAIEMEEADGMARSLGVALGEAATAAEVAAPAGLPATRSGDESGAGQGPASESDLLRRLVAEDFEGIQVDGESTATDLYLFEAFQFIRNAERIVSKVAGGLTKELSQRTVLPDADKNFRAYMSDLMARREDPTVRAELHGYLAKVFEWLYAAVHCYQKAALAVVEELRGELAPAALLRSNPLPWHARLPQGERSALWERAEARLETWNQSHVLDRLEAEVAAAARAFRIATDVEDL